MTVVALLGWAAPVSGAGTTITYRHTLTVEPGEGRVVSQPAGIDCGEICTLTQTATLDCPGDVCPSEDAVEWGDYELSTDAPPDGPAPTWSGCEPVGSGFQCRASIKDDPVVRLAPIVASSLPLRLLLSVKATVGRRATVLTGLTARRVPRGAKLTVLCRGTSCPRKRLVVRGRSGTVGFRAFLGHALLPGTRLRVALASPGSTSVAKTVTIRRARRPLVA